MVQNEKIIDPVDPKLIIKELSSERFGRNTRKGENEIYSVNNHNAPHTMMEIGRLREISFRSAGGGTHKSFDIDEFDTCENCYQQLIVWNPEDKEIIGGLRYIDCAKILPKNIEDFIPMSTSHYFNFSHQFIENYLPYSIELGRSWVQPKYQPKQNPRKGLYALDNLWDGLGLIVAKNPSLRYFFGKVTMYPDYHRETRDFILYFLRTYFPDNENLGTPIYPIEQHSDERKFEALINGLSFEEGYKVLTQFARENGENVPPLMNIYMHLSSTMRSFGTSINPDFGGVEETGIVMTIADIYEDKKERHIESIE